VIPLKKNHAKARPSARAGIQVALEKKLVKILPEVLNREDSGE
jgi:hypothetical protein